MSRTTTVTLVTMALLASLSISSCALAEQAKINSSSNLVQSSIISQESPSLVGSWNCRFSHPKISAERNTSFNFVFTLDGRFGGGRVVTDPYLYSVTNQEGIYQVRDNLLEVIVQKCREQNHVCAAITPYSDQSFIQWISPNKVQFEGVTNRIKMICFRASY